MIIYRNLLGIRINPIADHLRNVFETIVTSETMVAVDKMIVALKSRHKLKNYMPQNPTNWGYKLR